MRQQATYALRSLPRRPEAGWSPVSDRTYLARRAVFAVFAAWLVVSVTFGAIVVAPDSQLGALLGAAAFGGADEAELDRLEEQYLAERGQDRPVAVRYVDWMYSMATLQWGESFETGEPVTGLIAGALSRTAMYVLPATVLSVAVGVGAGVYGALRPESVGDRGGRLLAYLALGVPNFAVGLGLLVYMADPLGRPSGLLVDHVLPVVLLATTLVGAMLSYTRATSREYVGEAFVKLVRAKGAADRRVAVHVLRNAAPPLFALLFAELLAVLLLGVFVIEQVFRIDGFGSLLLAAVHDRDTPVLLSGTLVVVFVGIVGNFLKDAVAVRLDPRVGEE